MIFAKKKTPAELLEAERRLDTRRKQLQAELETARQEVAASELDAVTGGNAPVSAGKAARIREQLDGTDAAIDTARSARRAALEADDKAAAEKLRLEAQKLRADANSIDQAAAKHLSALEQLQGVSVSFADPGRTRASQLRAQAATLETRADKSKKRKSTDRTLEAASVAQLVAGLHVEPSRIGPTAHAVEAWAVKCESQLTSDWEIKRRAYVVESVPRRYRLVWDDRGEIDVSESRLIHGNDAFGYREYSVTARTARHIPQDDGLPREPAQVPARYRQDVIL